ncbi:MAG TPA: hypothetical protein VIW29_00895, partial [Polyangiaceae bacterium]
NAIIVLELVLGDSSTEKTPGLGCICGKFKAAHAAIVHRVDAKPSKPPFGKIESALFDQKAQQASLTQGGLSL